MCACVFWGSKTFLYFYISLLEPELAWDILLFFFSWMIGVEGWRGCTFLPSFLPPSILPSLLVRGSRWELKEPASRHSCLSCRPPRLEPLWAPQPNRAAQYAEQPPRCPPPPLTSPGAVVLWCAQPAATRCQTGWMAESRCYAEQSDCSGHRILPPLLPVSIIVPFSLACVLFPQSAVMCRWWRNPHWQRLDYIGWSLFYKKSSMDQVAGPPEGRLVANVGQLQRHSSSSTTVVCTHLISYIMILTHRRKSFSGATGGALEWMWWFTDHAWQMLNLSYIVSGSDETSPSLHSYSLWLEVNLSQTAWLAACSSCWCPMAVDVWDKMLQTPHLEVSSPALSQ